jgi:nitrate reductase assembly molybdenum cofactor insertion protein NarJ
VANGKNIYTLLAGLLEHPEEDIKIKAEQCIKALADYPQYPPEITEELKKFQKDLENIPLDDVKGVYSYTFELSSDFTLDLGYHVFDGFRRSNSLAAIKGMYIDKGFPLEERAGGELPDHLPVVLHFMSFTDDEELLKNFRETFLIKALEKLHKNFERNKKNLYWHVINAIYRIIDKDVKGGE